VHFVKQFTFLLKKIRVIYYFRTRFYCPDNNRNFRVWGSETNNSTIYNMNLNIIKYSMFYTVLSFHTIYTLIYIFDANTPEIYNLLWYIYAFLLF